MGRRGGLPADRHPVRHSYRRPESDDVCQPRPPRLAPIADPAQPAGGTRIDGAPPRAGPGPGNRQYDGLQGGPRPAATAGIAGSAARPKLNQTRGPRRISTIAKARPASARTTATANVL